MLVEMMMVMLMMNKKIALMKMVGMVGMTPKMLMMAMMP